MDGGTQVPDRDERRKVCERLRGPAFPIVLGRHPRSARLALEPLGRCLKSGSATVHGRFGNTLRGEIAFLYPKISRLCTKDALTPQETERLYASLAEAADRIEAWAERHGMDALDTDAEDAAARCGWPDENGNGWNPPWDILRMQKPTWWGTDHDPSATKHPE